MAGHTVTCEAITARLSVSKTSACPPGMRTEHALLLQVAAARIPTQQVQRL